MKSKYKIVSQPMCYGDRRYSEKTGKTALFMPKGKWWKFDGDLYRVRQVFPKAKHYLDKSWYIVTKMRVVSRYEEQFHYIDNRLFHAYDKYTLEGYLSEK